MRSRICQDIRVSDLAGLSCGFRLEWRRLLGLVQRSVDRVASLREVMRKKGLLRGWRWQVEFELPFPIHSSGGLAIYGV